MNRFRLLLSSLALSVLAASASAQRITMSISGGWVLNTSSSAVPTSVINSATSCGGTNVEGARVDYDIRLNLGAGTNPANVTAHYGGQVGLGCDPPPISASASNITGYATFVNSGTGSFSYNIESDAGVATNHAPHPNGQLSTDYTIVLQGSLTGSHTAFYLERSNSASTSGSSSTISNFATISGTKSNKDYFSVTVTVNGSSSINLNPGPDSGSDAVRAQELASTSFITLN